MLKAQSVLTAIAWARLVVGLVALLGSNGLLDRVELALESLTTSPSLRWQRSV